jgi:hypothetical protein
MDLLTVVAVVTSSAIIVVVAVLIRKGRLLERYAILWLLASLVLLVFSLWRGLLDIVAYFLGFYYPPAFLFLAGFVFLMLILLHFSIVISTLSKQNSDLAREVGLLRLELERLVKGASGEER